MLSSLDILVAAAGLTREQILAEVERIKASTGFSGAPSLRQLLDFTVEKALRGQAEEIKESTLAIEVFGRKTSFDPQSDPIVRVQARKLRDRIAAWYETQGALDEVIIEYFRGSYVPRFGLRGQGQFKERSIAVLPFRNLSNATALEYLCDGLADEIRYLLSRIHGFRIVARTSSLSVANSNDEVEKIGKMLNADLLIRGTVRSAGAKLRITVQVVAAEDGFLVWSERWERSDSDPFKLQDEIASAIAKALRSRVSQSSSSSVSTHDIEAHQLFLKGRFYWNQRTEHGFKRAIENYEAALVRDPGFARAYAALADTFTLIAAHHLERAGPCLERARECAMRAIALDSKLAAAHAALGPPLLMYDRKLRQAEQAWKTALDLDPNYAYAWHLSGVFRAFVQPHSAEPLACMEQAHRLEPLSPAIASDIAGVHYVAGRYDKTIEQALAALDLHPAFSRTYVFLARAQAALGGYEEAIATCLRARPLFTGRAFLGQLLATLGYCYGRTGRSADALATVAELKGLQAGYFVARIDLALIFTGMGDFDQALEQLKLANDEQEFWAISIPTEPLFQTLQQEPRFHSITRKLFQSEPAINPPLT